MKPSAMKPSVRRGSAWRRFVLLPATLAASLSATAQAPVTLRHGMAEASAAAALDASHFVVAEDECNILLVYSIEGPEPIGDPLDLTDFLETQKKASDIEGGARVGDTIYWISSRSLTRGGDAREWRRRFFATAVDADHSPPRLQALGKPYTRLLDDMRQARELASLHLDRAMTIAPELAGGLNIEGLASWDDGSLLIGFRGPLADDGQAILVPLENPDAVIRGQRARFGPPIFLGLGKRGIRSIDRVDGRYLIVAGPVANAEPFALYSWSGRRGDKAVLEPTSFPPGFIPEALAGMPGTGKVLALSDDGETNPNVDCDKRSKKREQKFRSWALPQNSTNP